MSTTLRSLWAELRRRRVTQIAAAYIVVSWLVVQVAVTTFPYLTLPGWAVTLVIALAALGFPIALVLAWAFDVTPEGLRRTDSVQVATAEPRSPADTSRRPERRESDGPDRTRLIVLPFRMLRPDPDTEFLVFSLPDAVSGSLAGLNSLVVRSNLAALRFAGDHQDLSTIAAQADVDVVLTGTLLRVGEQLRVSCQLTEAGDGTLVWSQTSQVSLGDLFSLQDQLAHRIVDSLQLPLTVRERQTLRQDVPASARAYEFYLRANQLAVQGHQWDTARDLYLACLELDSDYAPAWARLGRCYRLIGKYAADAETGAENAARAEEAFRRALRLNPELPVAHSLYAQLEVDLGRAPDAMVRLIARARANHGDPELFIGLVHACRFSGLLEASLGAHARARELDPAARTSVAHTHFMVGDYQGALRAYNEADIGYMDALVLTMLGQEADALARLGERERQTAPETVHLYLRSLRSLLAGEREQSLAAAREILASPELRDGEARFYIARQLARLSAVEEALDEVDRVLDMGFCCLHPLRNDPWLASLRPHPRFQQLIRRAEQLHHHAAEAFSRAGGEKVLPVVRPCTAPT